MMHHPIRPIEVGIVNDQHEHDTEKEIAHTMLPKIPIGLCVLRNRRDEYYITNSSKYEGGNDRVDNFSHIVFVNRKLWLNFLKEYGLPANNIKDQEGQ